MGLPVSLKRRGRTTKWLLRQLLYKRVPRELVDRPKMGFGVPLGDWFRGPLRERMDGYCLGSDFEDLGIDPAPVRRMWGDFKTGRSHRIDLLWQMFAARGMVAREAPGAGGRSPLRRCPDACRAHRVAAMPCVLRVDASQPGRGRRERIAEVLAL